MRIYENSPAPRPVQKEEQELLQEPKLGFPDQGAAQGEAAVPLQPLKTPHWSRGCLKEALSPWGPGRTRDPRGAAHSRRTDPMEKIHTGAGEVCEESSP